jgi:Trk K+ transport system NAD-binding subunit
MGADIFLALTEGDNRNIMAAQVATETFAIPQVIAKINDPVRAAAYSELGVVTLCRTNLMVDSVAKYLDLHMQTGPGIDVPETPGHEHPHPSAETIESPALQGGVQGRGAAGAVGPRTVTTSEVDEARARRLGFRRSRG